MEEKEVDVVEIEDKEFYIVDNIESIFVITSP